MEKLRHFLQSEKEKLRGLNRRQRLQYFWDYYKLPIGAVLLAAAMLIYTLCYNAGPGKIDLNAVLVNAREGDSTLFSQALQAGGWKSPQVRVDTTLTYTNAAELAEEDVATIQVLFAQFTMGDMDLFAANPEVFQRYTDQDGFENLGLLLPQQLQQDHPERLIRYTTEDGQEKIGGILLESGSPLHTGGYYSGPAAVGIVSRCEHLDEALAVIEFLLENTP